MSEVTSTLLRVAQYLRVSTDMQEYSILNQKEAISTFASVHGMRIVKTYVDEAKSGLHLRGRAGLNQLIRDAHDERRPFEAILVYDVSRWGRFQDTDESAYYEYVCKRAGAPVIYCGEPFANESTAPLFAVMKSIKRVMAAEYSRELGDKVSASKIRVSKLGFRAGSEAPFGYQRLLVDREGRSKLKLGRSTYGTAWFSECGADKVRSLTVRLEASPAIEMSCKVGAAGDNYYRVTCTSPNGIEAWFQRDE